MVFGRLSELKRGVDALVAQYGELEIERNGVGNLVFARPAAGTPFLGYLTVLTGTWRLWPEEDEDAAPA